MVWWRVLRFLHGCRSVKEKNGIVGNDSKWAFLLYYTKVSLLDNPWRRRRRLCTHHVRGNKGIINLAFDAIEPLWLSKNFKGIGIQKHWARGWKSLNVPALANSCIWCLVGRQQKHPMFLVIFFRSQRCCLLGTDSFNSWFFWRRSVCGLYLWNEMGNFLESIGVLIGWVFVRIQTHRFANSKSVRPFVVLHALVFISREKINL